eukprot:CAMPEP_0174359850 /NCGR_PEP_ID=MMETSP0811_2-20130205/50645_1 /TAXON_ID=73025 ORGANISM="Eutreptiella gymnastica-like, Strain CCMP1594" /NCGR_SAMPLE_ID=MMETSP0811_2 /ASSEMBLY_ACC=CAM_ASM_000667 /LENGTH=110 /DNA_ID=CAMNT_0015494923 /DNA_START=211 /DNA_END=539 /DNA_ORIENTATION=-
MTILVWWEYFAVLRHGTHIGLSSLGGPCSQMFGRRIICTVHIQQIANGFCTAGRTYSTCTYVQIEAGLLFCENLRAAQTPSERLRSTDIFGGPLRVAHGGRHATIGGSLR